MKKPQQLKKIDEQLIRSACEQYIAFIESDEYHSDNDFKQYIFEDVMNAVYGDNIFDWINKATDK